nr:PREDICTED: nuclear receptor 2C2-associated protein isoform X2 [Bemisia tabaci]
MFDNNEETCWNSDQGLPQWIQLDFEKEETVTHLQIQFQGGFVGNECNFELSSGQVVSLREPFYPEDVNTIQTFNLSKPTSCNSLKIVFNKSTDFFGRIVIYKLVVFNK